MMRMSLESLCDVGDGEIPQTQTQTGVWRLIQGLQWDQPKLSKVQPWSNIQLETKQVGSCKAIGKDIFHFHWELRPYLIYSSWAKHQLRPAISNVSSFIRHSFIHSFPQFWILKNKCSWSAQASSRICSNLLQQSARNSSLPGREDEEAMMTNDQWLVIHWLTDWVSELLPFIPHSLASHLWLVTWLSSNSTLAARLLASVLWFIPSVLHYIHAFRIDSNAPWRLMSMSSLKWQNASDLNSEHQHSNLLDWWLELVNWFFHWMTDLLNPPE